jgi:hypothetical protein
MRTRISIATVAILACLCVGQAADEPAKHPGLRFTHVGNIYIDGRHNKEVIYNADDTHFFVPRDHKGGWAKAIRGKVNWFTDARVQEIEGGYTVEISLSSNYFTGEGNWLPFGVKGVYGFDVAVDEEVGRQAWRGNEKLDEDTSVFGTILIVDEPATP